MRRIAMVAALLALAGCQTAQKSLVASCAGYAVALSTAADLRAQGKLSPALVDGIGKSIVTVEDLCDASKPLPADETAAVAKVDQAAADVAALLAGVKR